MESGPLPHEIIEEIFLWMPVIALVRFKCLSKSWHATIESSNFIKRHIKYSNQSTTNHHLILTPLIRSSFRDQTLNAYASNLQSGDYISLTPQCSWIRRCVGLMCSGSCNGLLLLHGYLYYEEVALWNPFNKTYRYLPTDVPDGCSPYYETIITFGFGYDEIHDDYKVVRIGRVPSVTNATSMTDEVKVYSLKTNTWKRTKDFIHSKHVEYLQSGVFVSGATHWLVRSYTPDVFAILAFNFEKETLQDLPLPKLSEESSNNKLLTAIQGYLCLISTCRAPSSATYQSTLYYMKPYGVRGSWNKSCIVRESDIPRELAPIMPLIYANKWGENIILPGLPTKFFRLRDAKKQIYTAIKLHDKVLPCNLVVCSESLVMLGQTYEFGILPCRNTKRKYISEEKEEHNQLKLKPGFNSNEPGEDYQLKLETYFSERLELLDCLLL